MEALMQVRGFGHRLLVVSLALMNGCSSTRTLEEHRAPTRLSTRNLPAADQRLARKVRDPLGPEARRERLMLPPRPRFTPGESPGMGMYFSPSGNDRPMMRDAVFQFGDPFHKNW